MKHLFIVNPVAGGKDSTEAVSAKVAQFFSGRDGNFEIYTTTAPMDACRKIEYEAALCDELRVYACGGDGTLNECVCGAAGKENVAVTHFPTGTGNDFIKSFGADQERFRDLEELICGEVRKLDVIDCNGRCSINICSVGVDARIAADVHKYSGLPIIGGATAYVTSLAVNLTKGITDQFRVISDGKLFYGKMSLVCVCNGSYYGGGFHPVPEARVDDGILDVLIVKGLSRLGFLKAVGAYAKGQYASIPEKITYLRTQSIEIDCEKKLVVNVDGEAIYGKKIRMKVIPRGVNFIVPIDMAYFHAEKEETGV